MPEVDLEQRLAATFAALREPALTADQRRALGPALRRGRARRHRAAGAAVLVLVVAGLAAGLPLGLRSAPGGPMALRAAPATCVEVQIGAAQSCRGDLVVSSGRATNNLAAPLSPSTPQASARSGAPASRGHAAPLAGVTVGTRLVISLPTAHGVRWSKVHVVPSPSTNFGTAASTAEGRVTARTTRAAGRTAATVIAVSPGLVMLAAEGRTACPAGETGCVARSATWSWVLRVVPQGAASGA